MHACWNARTSKSGGETRALLRRVAGISVVARVGPAMQECETKISVDQFGSILTLLCLAPFSSARDRGAPGKLAGCRAASGQEQSGGS